MIDPVLLSEIRDFLQDISTGAPVTDASRDHATEFVACLAGQPQSPDLEPVAWQWRYIGEGDHQWKTPAGGHKISDEVLKRERPIEQRPLFLGPDTRPLRTTGE